MTDRIGTAAILEFGLALIDEKAASLDIWPKP
jgi:hypothetical protein